MTKNLGLNRLKRGQLVDKICRLGILVFYRAHFVIFIKSTTRSTMDAQIQDLQALYSSEEQIDSEDDEQLEQPQLNKGSSFKEYIFNLKYNIIHSNIVPFAPFQRKPIELSPDSEPAYLLGNCYNYTQIEEFFKHFRSTIWMSYRATNKKTDAGWGCTIRAMQMVMAEVIKRNNPQVSVNQVVQLFKQGGRHPFSLDRICQRGNINARWTGFNQIASIITSILKEEGKKMDPRKNMKLGIQTEIFYGITTIYSKNKLESNQNMFPRLVVISNKIDKANQFNQAYIPHLQHMMKMPNFCGMVGGVSGEALFVVGFHQEKAIILDPHYVQEVKGKTEQVFFKKTPRGLPFHKLSPCMSICFFLRDANEYQIWSGQMCYAQRIYSPHVVTEIYAEDPNDQVEQYRKRSEQFQIL